MIGTADEIDHAWNLVELDGKWYHLDATWDDPMPDQGEDALHQYPELVYGSNMPETHNNW